MPPLVELNPPTVGIVYELDNVSAKNRVSSFGKGKLFITEDFVQWIRPDRQGFILSYPNIAIHAVSKDLSTFPDECLYLILSSGDPEEDGEEDGENDNGVEGMETDAAVGDAEPSPAQASDNELLLVPEDKAVLQAMFDALSRCQGLHPDPHDAGSDDEEVDNVDHPGNGDLADADIGDENFEDDDEEETRDEPAEFGEGDV